MRKWTFVLMGAIISLGYVGTAEADKAFLNALQEELHRRGDPWVAGETELSKLSLEEKRQLCGLLPTPAGFPEVEMKPRPPLKNLPPADMDWRDYNGKNWMTKVKQQGGYCGSCWDFAWVSAQEARMKIKKEDADWNPDLSEQFVLSCNTLGWDCRGGKLDIGNWIKQTGVPDEACYPYKDGMRQSGRSPCTGRCGDWQTRAELGKITNWGKISETISDNAMKEEIMRGPVAGAVELKEDFFYYKEGVYEPIMGEDMYGHGICVCGWNSSGAWLCKNSWGIMNPYFWYSGSWRTFGAWMDPAVVPDPGTPIIWTTDSLYFEFKGGEILQYSDTMMPDIQGDEHIFEKAHRKAYTATKFIPQILPCSLTHILIGTESLILNASKQCSVLVWGNGSVPGARLLSDVMTIESPEFGTLHVSSYKLSPPLSISTAFWVGHQEWDTLLPTIEFDQHSSFLSKYSRDGITWDNAGDTIGNYDYWHAVVVKYGGGHVGSGTIWVKNVGAGKLTMSDVHSAQGSSWITSIAPKSFNVYDPVGIEVVVYTSGLQIDVPYQDEIVITSNSGKTETRVPVTLIIKSGGVAEEKVSTLTMFKLSPNPFGDKVSLSYFVPEKTNVKLVVRDIAGRQVAKIVNKIENTGIKKIEWNTKDIPSGVYFCRLAIGDSKITRKVLLIR